MIIKRFEDIDAWRKARELTKAVYDISKTGEFSKDFGLKNQIQKASVSSMSNIAEGFDRQSNKEFVQFLVIARASVSELKSQLYVALDQGYINQAQFRSIYDLANDVVSLINGFMRYLKKHK